MVQHMTVHTKIKSVSTLSQASHASKIGDVTIFVCVPNEISFYLGNKNNKKDSPATGNARGALCACVRVSAVNKG